MNSFPRSNNIATSYKISKLEANSLQATLQRVVIEQQKKLGSRDLSSLHLRSTIAQALIRC